MSFLKLAVLAVVVVGFVPFVAQASPDSLGKIKITSGGPLKGTVKEDNQDVIPFEGNATAPVTVEIPCALYTYERATQSMDSNHFHVQLAGKAPEWLEADEFEVALSDAAVAQACAGKTSVTFPVNFPFSVAAGAPAIKTQLLNLTVDFGAGDASVEAPLSLPFVVGFHPNYTVEPSISFPYTLTTPSVNFTMTVTNHGNARGMVMFEELHVSTGSLSSLPSVPYDPPETKTFDVVFKAPTTCWQNATVEFKTFPHFLLLDQRAGSYKEGQTHHWEFVNGIACTPGKDPSKKSPVGGLIVMPALLVVAFALRRRVA